MKRVFLLVTWDGGGVVPPLMGICRRLIAAGHTVHVLANPTVEAEARAAGAGFLPLTRAPHRTSRDRDADILADYRARNKMKFLKEELGEYFFGRGSDWTADVLAAIDTVGADVVLTDSMLPWPVLAAELRGLPSAALATMPLPISFPATTPSGAAMLPVPGFLERPRNAFLRWVSEWLFDNFLVHINRVRAEHGREPLAHTLDQVRQADAILTLTSTVFDFGGKGAPPHVYWTGPMLDDPTWAAPWEDPWPADDPRPLVIVGLSSTFQDHVGLLNRAVEALAGLPVRAVVTLGPTLRPDEVPAKGDVCVVQSAPHGALLPRADLLITHAGHGTTLKGLAAGVPMVCVPLGRDQGDNAARVVALGAGVKVAGTATAAELATAVQKVLGTPSFREAARTAAAAIARKEGEHDAVALLEAIVPRSPPPEARTSAA